ncbi:hypothetical protein YPPY19_2611, partial [Yersinia pestis PY-19]
MASYSSTSVSISPLLTASTTATKSP